MKLRRVLVDGCLQLQSAGDDGEWAPAPDPSVHGGAVFDREWEPANAQRHFAASGHVLPVQPASFRDFMLYERHAIDAARGLVRRFHPGQSRVAARIEKLTGRPFPMSAPKPLFHRQPIYYMSNHLSFVPSGGSPSISLRPCRCTP